MREKILNQIFEHVEHEYPKEACGLLVFRDGREQYVPSRNISETLDSFVLDPKTFMFEEDNGQVLRVVHSHCNEPAQPSDADIRGCQKSGLPWTIVAWPSKQVCHINPEDCYLPLLGRVFYHGMVDCYSLLIDWHWEVMGVEIPDFQRWDDWWKEDGVSLYLDNYEKAGFIRLPQERANKPKPGDVFLINFMSKVPNHAAIYVGDGKILHHPPGSLSREEIYCVGGYWHKHTQAVVQHKELYNAEQRDAE